MKYYGIKYSIWNCWNYINTDLIRRTLNIGPQKIRWKGFCHEWWLISGCNGCGILNTCWFACNCQRWPWKIICFAWWLISMRQVIFQLTIICFFQSHFRTCIVNNFITTTPKKCLKNKSCQKKNDPKISFYDLLMTWFFEPISLGLPQPSPCFGFPKSRAVPVSLLSGVLLWGKNHGKWRQVV